jgi:hypothetical protein
VPRRDLIQHRAAGTPDPPSGSPPVNTKSH